MARKITWTEPALGDLDAIADYIDLGKPLAAKLLVRKIFEKVALLGRFPRMGAVHPELRDMPYRQLVIPPCRIFYRSQRTTLTVVAVIRAERKLMKELLDRH
ncbi:MAG TPA: type II toxin-antitoxin system RelE/ParE family toxin [bacterium]|nr:type II toxin-antitoxin system RelE/ParE family toxin [bacterium]